MKNSDSIRSKRHRFDHLPNSSQFSRKKHRPLVINTASIHIQPLGLPLVSTSQTSSSESINLEPYRPYTIGRAHRHCDFVFEDRRVSKKHFQILFDANTHTIPLISSSFSTSLKTHPSKIFALNSVYSDRSHKKMALETWLIKVKTAISNSFDSVRGTAAPPTKLIKKSKVGVLAFEIAGLMSKLLHLWQSLSDKNIIRLRNEALSFEGVRKIVSNDETLLLGLACAEIVENLRLIAKSVSTISKKCEDSSFRSFDRLFIDFANTGRDPHNWVLSWKEIEIKNKKIDKLITSTTTLYREMEELSILENSLRKQLQCKDKEHEVSIKQQKIIDLQQKILWQRQEVKYLKERSIWNRSFDTASSLLARSIFTVLARIKLVFGIGNGYPASLPRSLSASATVYPSENPTACNFVSGPLMKSCKNQENKDSTYGFFESNSKILKPPSSTLGAAALALHYANLIIVMEKMIRSPHMVGVDARDDLYSMLPSSIRSMLRARLKGVGFSASDPVLAGEWREALGKILGWLSPLAHNMIKWQSERSFEHQNLMPKTNVLLLQTLFFASKEKTEAAITELLVGLNYIWRFDREMNAKALFEGTNFNGFLNLQTSS